MSRLIAALVAAVFAAGSLPAVAQPKEGSVREEAKESRAEKKAEREARKEKRKAKIRYLRRPKPKVWMRTW